MSALRLPGFEINIKHSSTLEEYASQVEMIHSPCKKALVPRRSKRSPWRTISRLIGQAEGVRPYQPLGRTPFKHVRGAR
jgi:hypothetical protein